MFPVRSTIIAIVLAVTISTLTVFHLADRPPDLLAQGMTPTPGPYAGQQSSSVRGLTEAEIDDLRNGRGMGLARPAEINGYPGPRHVLDLANELGLTEEQRTAVQGLFEQMKAEAVPLGEQILSQYAELESGFRESRASIDDVAQWTGQLGQLEGQLRATHLKYHLLTRPLLTDAQNAAYAQLRGYAESGAPSAPAPRHQPGMQPTHGP
jgi:hypothetical protein